MLQLVDAEVTGTSRDEYNGKSCRVTGFDAEQLRYTCDVGGGKVLGLALDKVILPAGAPGKPSITLARASCHTEALGRNEIPPTAALIDWGRSKGAGDSNPYELQIRAVDAQGRKWSSASQEDLTQEDLKGSECVPVR